MPTVPALERAILLVEDSARDAELLLDALDGDLDAARIVHVRDGVEALAFLRREGAFAARVGPQPALILLDLKMPRMNGMELLAVVKADDTLRQIPVVLMTSSQQDQDLAAAYRLGVNAYVRKPLEFDAFIRTARHVIVFWATLNLLPTTDPE
ncbi:MAG: response regulator [Gemmatimonadota bacterium]|jgi:CheY-like chemotaxis protein|nr:response regulator [Gemmatimonadota bacterium]MDQ8167918.1 response regulator [Gemmatimonadota bacterium]MDQ8172776.1 response regulator [Gemmatimonadota bacterium]